MFAYATRSATIRTRVDPEEIRERMAAIAAEPAPEGYDRAMADGYFSGVSVDARSFAFDYTFNSHTNRQVYAVRGRVTATRDWRIVRLQLTARRPFAGWAEMGGVVVAMVYVLGAELTLAQLALGLLCGWWVLVFLNYLAVPNIVKNRVAASLADRLGGTVLRP